MERTEGENWIFSQTIKPQKFSNINGLRNQAIRKAISFRVRPVMTASIRLHKYEQCMALLFSTTIIYMFLGCPSIRLCSIRQISFFFISLQRAVSFDERSSDHRNVSNFIVFHSHFHTKCCGEDQKCL